MSLSKIIKTNKEIVDLYLSSESVRQQVYSRLVNLLDSYTQNKEIQPDQYKILASPLVRSLIRHYHSTIVSTLDPTLQERDYSPIHTKEFIQYINKQIGKVSVTIQDLKNLTDLPTSTEQGTTTGRIDEVEDKSLSEDDSHVDISEFKNEPVDDVEELVSAILKRNEAVFRSCFELDRPYGMLYPNGAITFTVEKGKLRLKRGANKNGKSIFEQLYKAIAEGCGVGNGSLQVANDLRLAPNYKNITENSFVYYPAYLLKYALGVADDKVYRNWRTFSKALDESVSKRLLRIYKQDGFYDNIDKLESAFSCAMLILSYQARTGIKLRVSLPGKNLQASNIEKAIKSIKTYMNASVTVVSVSGYTDVVDIQILQDENEFLGKPTWAYQSMAVKINNGDAISLSEGVPMGRKVNGEIVNFKLDPSLRFSTLICAGSGAGKGVLTLSLLAAGIGSGVPIMYTDYKPDMAKIFWDLEKQYGIKTFTYDAMVKHCQGDDAPNHTLKYGMPSSLLGSLGKFAGQILYLKSLQLMCAMAEYRADNGFDESILFVFDEIEAMQLNIQRLSDAVVDLLQTYKPAKNDNPSLEYVYLKVLHDWIIEIDANINTYMNTTGRTSSTFTLFIGQTPDKEKWSDLACKLNKGRQLLLGRVTTSNTVSKIMGKGSTTSKYGLGGDGKKNIAEKELQYVTNNRFFGMYDGKTTDGANIQVFKPFLTLNTDDLDAPCWTNGLGQMYGAGDVPNEEYYANVQADHPPTDNYVGKQGTHSGIGFLGLSSMYCNGDIGKLKTNLEKGYHTTEAWFKTVGLDAKYSCVRDYMYDCSLDGIMFLENMVAYDPNKENSVKYDLSSDDLPKLYGEDNDIEVDEEVEFNIDGFNAQPTPQPTIKVEKEEEVDLADLGLEIPNDFTDSPSLEVPSDIGIEDANELEFSEEESTTPKEIYVSKQQNSIFQGGSKGNINLDFNNIKSATRLTEENSIDCTRVNTLSFRDRMLLKTPRGVEKYVSERFDRLLKDIMQRGMNVANITRVKLVHNGFYINDKLVRDGITGGVDNVQLRDIVNFQILFKRFLNLRDLYIDDIMLNALLVEYNTFENVFNSTKLERLMLISYTGSNKATVKTITRANISQTGINNIEFDNSMKSALDINKSTKSKFKGGLNGDDLHSVNLSKKQLGKASSYLNPRNKVSLTKGLFYGTLGAIGGLFGLVAMKVSRVGNKTA